MEAEQPDGVVEVEECTINAQAGNGLDQGDALNDVVSSDPNLNSETSGVSKSNGLTRNAHKVPLIYREDVVRKSNDGVFGVVTEVAGDSDSDSEITDEEDDDDEDEQDDEDSDGENINEEEGVCDGQEKSDQNVDKNDTDYSYTNSRLTADQVRVLWMNDTESTENANDLTAVDRGFLHGDYVAAASDPTGQVGAVVNVSLSVDLLSPNGSVIKNVSTKDLKRVRDLTVGDYVVFGPWLGRIDDVIDNVTVLFDDGSVCKVMRADPLRLRPITKNLLDDGHFPYYPGQRVRASSSSVFKNSRWLSGLWKANRMEGTVTKVTAGSVFVYWIASAGYGPDSSTAPAEEQSPKNLKLLSSFVHANWQLGDWCLLPSSAAASSTSLDKGLSNLEIHESKKNKIDLAQTGVAYESEESVLEDSQGNDEYMDVDVKGTLNEKNESQPSIEFGSSLSVSKESVHESRPLHRKKIRKVVVKRDKRPRKKEESFERAFQIVNIRTRVDVSWQDGTIQHGVDSTSLIPIESPGDHEFVPEQYVVEKASDDDSYDVKRVGVVQSVNAKERTACVKWLKPLSRAEDPREFEKEEIVSVYELEGHPDYDYCYGDVVVRLTPVSVSAEKVASMDSSSQENGINEVKDEKNPGGEKVQDASGGEGCLKSSDLSWVGHITGLRNGDIEVTWADGMISTVGPQAIYVVGRDDDDESIGAESAVSDDAASWETVEDDETGAIENEKEEDELQHASDRNSESEDGEEASSGRKPALSFPLTAIGYVTRLASGIFSRARKDEESDSANDKCENELQSPGETKILENENSRDEPSSQKSNLLDKCNIEDEKREELLKAEDTDLLERKEALHNAKHETMDARESSEDYRYNFKRFDIAGDPEDHHFLGVIQQNNGRKWFKKVQQDWSILQSNLPDGIFVRVYEDRMDLMRAVIVGAYGTPYQDGLFVFDFHLPPEYPDVPPSAHYRSGGWRINPNLYEEGKVCLSLLNTWTGRGNEVWDPLSSSILQVLVSLQGLVLNSRPYFNEAGYDKQIGTAEGEKNSLSYNENTFLLNCKTMMYLIRRPPKDFEELVIEHFKKRGYYILKASDAYMRGYLIGSLAKDASVSDESDANSTSVGFKLMLAKIVPKLYLALNEVGGDCQDFKHLLEP